ncbi:MAG: dihydroorotate dehydrogenase-like protein [Verrucomicrobiota bacterium]
MDLSTTYLGLKLRNPLVPSASPLSEDIGNLRKMEDNGAGAVVLQSLFEEQLSAEADDINVGLHQGDGISAEALSYFPEPSTFKFGPEEYLEHIIKAKQALKIPVIASLNGASVGGWIEYAKQIQKAGADALELNIYYIPTDVTEDGAQVEKRYLDIVKTVRAAVNIPLAVKLSPYFSSVGHMAKRLDDAGVNGLVLFNRFYQPDINLSTLEVENTVLLSTAQARRLPLRWIALLYGRVKADLAATSGVHSAQDVLKMLMAGARVTMFCSALMKHGIEHLKVVEREMQLWMQEHEYESVRQMQGSVSQLKCADPSAFERAQYMKVLKTFKLAV